MPYIKNQERRKIIDVTKDVTWEVARPENEGELNYVITRICSDYLKRTGVSYNTLKDVKGVLADARDEIHDRLMRPYEDSKRKEYGDAFDVEVLNVADPLYVHH